MFMAYKCPRRLPKKKPATGQSIGNCQWRLLNASACIVKNAANRKRRVIGALLRVRRWFVFAAMNLLNTVNQARPNTRRPMKNVGGDAYIHTTGAEFGLMNMTAKSLTVWIAERM